MSPLDRCPFVAAVVDGRLDDAAALAAALPEPAEPAVIAWLVAEVQRQVHEDAG